MSAIKLMISSRSTSSVTLGSHQVSLRDLRRQLKSKLQDQLPVKVWIFEDDPETKGTGSAIAECILQARSSDVVLVLYNGDAGDPGKGGIGICHQEYNEAMNQSPGKVCIIDISSGNKFEHEKDRFFSEDIHRHGKLYAKPNSINDFFEKATSQVKASIVRLVRMGRGSLRSRNRSLGQALDWARYSFDRRKSAIIDSIHSYLKDQVECFYRNECYYIMLSTKAKKTTEFKIRLAIGAIPASINISEAAGPLGKPHSFDFEIKFKGNEVGPIHIIGVYSSVTEGQARKFLGIDNGMFVQIEGAGLFAVDTIQNCQIMFLTHCINETTTGTRVQNFFSWLNESGESALVAHRAKARREIAKKIKEFQYIATENLGSKRPK